MKDRFWHQPRQLYLNKYGLSTPSSLNQALVTTQLEKDQRVAITYAIHATPTVFINGLRIEGDFAESELDEEMEEELDAVDLLEQEPVPLAKIYATRVHANLLDLDLE